MIDRPDIWRIQQIIVSHWGRVLFANFCNVRNVPVSLPFLFEEKSSFCNISVVLYFLQLLVSTVHPDRVYINCCGEIFYPSPSDPYQLLCRLYFLLIDVNLRKSTTGRIYSVFLSLFFIHLIHSYLFPSYILIFHLNYIVLMSSLM